MNRKFGIRVLVLVLAFTMVMGLTGMTALADDGVAFQIPAEEITPEMVQGANYLVSRFPSLKSLVSASKDEGALILDPNETAENAVKSGLASGNLLGVPVSEIPARIASAMSTTELGQKILGQVAGLLGSGSIKVK